MYYFLFFCGGVVFGAIVVGFMAMTTISKPKDPEIIKKGLIAKLPTSTHVTFEWLYFELELSPKDTYVLRNVLREYIENEDVEKIEEDDQELYRMRKYVKTLA